MTKKSGLFIFLLLIVFLLVYFVIKDGYDEKQITTCIEEILISQQISSIQATTKNRGQKPVLTGKLTQEVKFKLLNSINNRCHVIEIQDFIEVIEPPISIKASLNFKIDHVNNIIYISGLVMNQQQVDNILHSFTTAIKDNFPVSEVDWTLSPNILIDENVQAVNFSIYITLLFTAIDTIKLTDITIENKQFILKGLIRDKIREKETLSKIRQLFDSEYQIINQLELVVQFKPDIQDIEFEPFSPPLFEKPRNNPKNP